MRTARFQVLSQEEVERIHAASMDVLATVGIKVDYKTARDLFRQAGAEVDDERARVRLSERLVRWAVDQAPGRFTLYGAEPDFGLEIGGGRVQFAGLGTPTHVIDQETGSAGPPRWPTWCGTSNSSTAASTFTIRRWTSGPTIFP